MSELGLMIMISTAISMALCVVTAISVYYIVDPEGLGEISRRHYKLDSDIKSVKSTVSTLFEQVNSLDRIDLSRLETLDTLLYHETSFRKLFQEGFNSLSDMVNKAYEDEIKLFIETRDLDNGVHVDTGFCPNGSGLSITVRYETSASDQERVFYGEDNVKVLKTYKLEDVVKEVHKINNLKNKICCKPKTKKRSK